jgi:hypothetical protein
MVYQLALFADDAVCRSLGTFDPLSAVYLTPSDIHAGDFYCSHTSEVPPFRMDRGQKYSTIYILGVLKHRFSTIGGSFPFLVVPACRVVKDFFITEQPDYAVADTRSCLGFPDS